MKSPSLTTWVAAGSLALLAALFAAHGNAQDKAAAKANGASGKPALTVTTISPQRVELALNVQAAGNIAAWQEAVIGAESGGLRMTEVRVNVGDVVHRGQVLATFAAETVEAELAQARANLAEADASLADARANAVRAHPTEEHYLPLLVAMGAAGMHPSAERVYAGIELGSLSMDAWLFHAGEGHPSPASAVV